jgi:hypothetical protein
MTPKQCIPICPNCGEDVVYEPGIYLKGKGMARLPICNMECGWKGEHEIYAPVPKASP